MNFYPEGLFHIYNQGNRKQQVFFSDDDYLLFLWKMRTYLPPFGDLVAYCLMPNHFHWLFYVKQVQINRDDLRLHVARTESLRKRRVFDPSDFTHNMNGLKNNTVTLNESIGVLQRSYTQFINTRTNDSGSLFRKKCKAKDGWIDEFVTLKHKSGRDDYRFMPGNSYALTCLHYIHDNAPEAGLVSKPEDWPYSSARDYAGLRRGSLCNLKLGRELMLF